MTGNTSPLSIGNTIIDKTSQHLCDQLEVEADREVMKDSVKQKFLHAAVQARKFSLQAGALGQADLPVAFQSQKITLHELNESVGEIPPPQTFKRKGKQARKFMSVPSAARKMFNAMQGFAVEFGRKSTGRTTQRTLSS
eukprot:747305-Hanusia_phi.AAC.1